MATANGKWPLGSSRLDSRPSAPNKKTPTKQSRKKSASFFNINSGDVLVYIEHASQGAGAMSATAAQRQFFNPFVDFNKQRSGSDIWFGVPKREKRESTKALVFSFLLDGGKITKIPSKTAKGQGRRQAFTRVGGKTSEREYLSYFGGNHGWTSKPDNSVTAYHNAGKDHRSAVDHGRVAYIGPVMAGSLDPRESGTNQRTVNVRDASAQIVDIQTLTSRNTLGEYHERKNDTRAIDEIRRFHKSYKVESEWQPGKKMAA
jgi:hypothetical protein